MRSPSEVSSAGGLGSTTIERADGAGSVGGAGGGAAGSGGMRDGRSTNQVTTAITSSAAKALLQRLRSSVANQDLVTVQLTVWIEFFHAVAWQ